MAIKFSLDDQRYSTKPNRSETARIQRRVGQNAVDVELAQLPDIITKVGEQGYTIAPGVFKDGKRNKENFKQQQLFMLDFDNSDPKREITPDEFMDRCRSLDLPVTATYETFSSTKENPRFRAIFLNDAPVADKRLATDMARMLGAIFPEADPCWKDYSRLYFGGKKLLHITNDITDTINVKSLIEAHDRYVYLNDKNGKHYREKINRFWKGGKPYVASGDAGEKLTNADDVSTYVKNGGNLPNSIILNTNIDSGKIPPFYEVLYSDTQQRISKSSPAPPEQNSTNHPSAKRNPYRSNLLEKLPSVCRLYNEFICGERELSHDELWGMATNLIQIEGGQKLFLEICDRFPELHTSDNPKRDWSRQLYQIKEAKYKPTQCGTYCGYAKAKKCRHGKNMLSTVVPKVMEKVDGYSLGIRALSEVQRETEKAIRNACKAQDIRVYVINSGTAIGKTTILIKIVSKRGKELFLIAEPTNLMKHELLERFHKAGIEAMETPSLDELKNELSPELWKKLSEIRRIGEATTPYIAKIIRNGKLSKSDTAVLRKYLHQKQKLQDFNGVVVTTHRYLAVCDKEWLNRFDQVVIDEDILYKLVATNHTEVSMRKLEKAAAKTSNADVEEKIRMLKRALKNGSGYVELDRIDCDDEDAADIRSFNLKAFCEAVHFYVRAPEDKPNQDEAMVSFVAPLNLPEDMKLIVVSATANEEVYEQFFGPERVNFKMCNRAPYQGTLQQYYGLSMSRSCLKNHPGIIEYIRKHFGIPHSNVITYLSENIGKLHFGNAEGSNILEGKDILVVGSAYQPPFIYVLAAAALGFDIGDEEMRHQRIEYNGYRFKYQAFDDEDLRTVQLWMTESELEQAVGRARLLRHDCTVYLFSNFPVQQSQMIDGYTVYGSFKDTDVKPTPEDTAWDQFQRLVLGLPA